MNSEPTGEAPAKMSERLFDHHMWWILVLGLCGIAVYQMFKYQAFPAASIDIKKSRLEIQAEAKALAPKLGYTKTGLIESTVFDNDDEGKTFLEHEFPQDKANQLMASEVPIWFWKTHLCKEFDQEDFTSRMSPQGVLLAFDRDIPNDVAIESVSHDEARKLALAYLKRMEPKAENFSALVKDEEFTRAKREDHSFTWEDRKNDYKSARLRIDVEVSGNQVSRYGKYLHVPDKWERDWQTKRSYNYLLGQIAFAFIYLFQTVAFAIFVWGIITKNVRWRPAVFGAVLLGGISALDYLNHLPSLISGYSPTTSFNAYIISLVVRALVGLVGNAIMGMFLFAGAEIVYRKLFPQKVSFEKILTRVGLTHISIVRGVIVGHLLVGVHLGWIVLYYIFGKNFGFWCPLGLESHEVLSNIVPFVSGIALGVSASFEEELACRIIGIGIGTRLFKNFWIANLLQAVVWAFAHSSYPQEPAYARGIELTLMGLLMGWILHRYGIVAVITEHYLVDAFMYVEALLYSDLAALKLSAIPALIPPLLIVLLAFALKKQKRLETGGELDNDKIPLVAPPPPPPEEPPRPIEYVPLSKRIQTNLLVLCIFGVLSAMMLPWSNGINADARLQINRADAIARAREIMAKHRIDPKDWMETAWAGSSPVVDDFQYIFEKTDADITKRIFDETRRGYYWCVRFFKPLESEQYNVYLDGRGNEISFDITREEDDAGAKLTQGEARRLAEKYLADARPEFEDSRFEKISTEKRKDRIDYTVEFTCPKLKIAEAACRINIEVIGDQVGNFRQWWDVPDSWKFEREKRTAKDEWLGHLRTANFFILIVAFLFWCYSVLKTGAIKYRVALALACVYIVVLILGQLNNLPSFFAGYTTTTPVNSYITSRLVSAVSSVLGSGAGLFLLAAVALGALRIICPRTPIGRYITVLTGLDKSLTPEKKKMRLSMWFDGTLVAYASVAFTAAVSQLNGMVSRIISPSVPTESISALTEFTDDYVPIAEWGLSNMQSLPMLLSIAVVVAGMVAKYSSGFWRLLAVALVVTLIVQSGERYWQDYLLGVLNSILICLFLYVIFTQLARNNYVTYALIFLLADLTRHLPIFIFYGPTLFAGEIVTLSVLAVLPLLVVVTVYLRNWKLLKS